jgi:HPP family
MSGGTDRETAEDRGGEEDGSGGGAGDDREEEKVKEDRLSNESPSWKRGGGKNKKMLPSSSSSNPGVDFVLPPAAAATANDGGGIDATDADGSTSSKRDKKRSAKTSKTKVQLAYKRSMSSATPATQYDTHLLKRAVEDAGRWAYGIILVEVWALNQDQTFLYRPDNGFWIDPVYHTPRCHPPNCQICRLVDPHHPAYVEPRNQSPGQGLPGVLWSEVAQSWTKSFRETLAGKILGNNSQSSNFNPNKRSTGGMSSSNNSFLEPNAIRIHTSHFSSSIVWRSIPQLDSDPDQPWNPRLKLLAALGLGLAAAVPFNLHGDQGIVMYVARNRVDRARLQSESNESYLVSATDLIAAAYALRGPRQQVVKDRHSELSSALHRVRDKVLELKRQGLDLKEYVDKNSGGGTSEVLEDTAASDHGLRQRKPRAALKAIKKAAEAARAELATSIRKAKGAGAPIPPGYSWRQTLVTFVGSLTTLLAITSLSDRVQTMWGPDYGMVLGCVHCVLQGKVLPRGVTELTQRCCSCFDMWSSSPFGASMTLLYGLTAAPASQPRNVVYGQIVSMTIAVLVSYAAILPVWLRQSLGAALAIAAMVKLGITHPPAGATALILTTAVSTSQRSSWGNMATSLLGNVIAIGMSTVINNASNKRQYPIYWGFSREELTRPFLWTWSAIQQSVALGFATLCRWCCWCRPASRSRGGPRRHRAGSSAAPRLRPSRRVSWEADLEDGSA